MFQSAAGLLNSANAAAGQVAKLQANVSNGLDQVNTVAGQAGELRAQGNGILSEVHQSSIAGEPQSQATTHTPPTGAAALDIVEPPVPVVGGEPKLVAPPGASTRTETEIDVKCGEMRKMFQQVVRSAFTEKDSTEYEMLVGLITEKIVENNKKLVNIIASTLPITNSAMKIRFRKNLNDKFERGKLIGGGKRTQQKRKRKQVKNGTKRRK
jgi:hypothetical protein